MKVYTRAGDDGTTGLLYGGRVPKNSELPVAYGGVDEAQAALGVARAECQRGDDLDTVLVAVMADLWVLMAELATLPQNRSKLSPGATLVTQDMVDALETHIDAFSERFDPPTEFVVPGQTRTSALLDVARTVVRRAERDAITAASSPTSSNATSPSSTSSSSTSSNSAPAEAPSLVVPYLNRLSDLVWTLARWEEGNPLPTRAAMDPQASKEQS
jgi:cob(I)alamin adenosyltransferase